MGNITMGTSLRIVENARFSPQIGHAGHMVAKPNLILCLALVLGGGFVTRADETNAPVSTNATQSYVDPTVETNWTVIKVTLHRTNGRTEQLDAKRVLIKDRAGSYNTDENVVAFVDPQTGNAWVGPIPWAEPYFYLETETNIVCGMLAFGVTELNGVTSNDPNIINGASAWAGMIWRYSYVPNVTRGKNEDGAVEEFIKELNINDGWIGLPRRVGQTWFPINEPQRGEKGLNAWLFLPVEKNGLAMIGAVEVSEGKLRLDFKGPDGEHLSGSRGVHTASVWIDLKTWQVVKAIQDGKS